MGIARKIAVMLPVVVIGTVYAVMRHQQFQHGGHKRLAVLIFSLLLFYVWVGAGVFRRRQPGAFDMLVQSSFYIYVFSVLTLTGYFILFNQVSAHGWWHKIVERVHTRNGVNLQAFLFMNRKSLLAYEVVGNFIMLFPLGIYLPLLYRGMKNVFTVTFTAMLLSASIELMQLATNFRITDIDDVVLNTAGALLGFVVYCIVNAIIVKSSQPSGQQQYNQGIPFL